MFDVDAGEIFTVRVAGNVASGADIAGSLEYAAYHLKVRYFLVLGHTCCGAVAAANPLGNAGFGYGVNSATASLTDGDASAAKKEGKSANTPSTAAASPASSLSSASDKEGSVKVNFPAALPRAWTSGCGGLEGHIPGLLTSIMPAVRISKMSGGTISPVEANVHMQVDALRVMLSKVQPPVVVEGAVFEMETGNVKFLDGEDQHLCVPVA